MREECSISRDSLGFLSHGSLHPTEDRAVGVKLKGIQFVLEQLRAMKPEGVDLSLDKVNLMSLWETACTIDGDEFVVDADTERRKQ